MPAPQDLYALLGVSPRASDAEIRRAYRQSAVYRHRRGVLRIQDTLEDMERAYKILTDPECRQRYDRQRELYEAPGRQTAEQDSESLRREGQIRRAYSKRIAADARRIARDRQVEHQALIEELEQELARRPARPDRRLWLLGLVLVAGLAALLIVLR